MSGFRTHITDLRQRTRTFMSLPHASTDMVGILNEWLQAAVDFERLLSNAEGQGGDLRILKSKNEMLASEAKKKTDALQSFKKKVADIVTAEIRNITSEVGKISAATQGEPDSNAQQAAKAINQSLRNLIEFLSKA
jgi:hypothetical protein